MEKYDKQRARMAVQARLNLLTDDEYKSSVNSVLLNVSRVLADLQTKGTLKNVLSYHASPKWREVDLSPLEREFKDIKFDYVPVDAQALFPAARYDIVLVPLYGFNDEGYRLGHGSGWYDRFLLTQSKALKVGVGLEASRIYFAAESHDIAMNVIVTD